MLFSSDSPGEHVFSLNAWRWRPHPIVLFGVTGLFFIITTGSALCERLSIGFLPLERNSSVMRCHCRTHQCRGKPIGLARSDADKMPGLLLGKALESQEKDIVTEFSSMTIFDKIALGVHSNPSSSPPTLRFIPKGEFRAECVKKAFENFSN